MREQLHFCVILTLNNAYYQVREAETQAFYELFRIELESRNLEELLRRFLESLVQVCRADAGRLYMLNEDALGLGAAGRGSARQPRCRCPNRPGLIKKLSKPRYVNGEHSLADCCWMTQWHKPLRILLVDSAGHRRAHRRRHAVRLFERSTSGCRGNRNCWPPRPSAA